MTSDELRKLPDDTVALWVESESELEVYRRLESGCREAADQLDRLSQRVAESRDLLREVMAEGVSFQDDRINYVEKQLSCSLLRDIESFLKRTEGQ